MMIRGYDMSHWQGDTYTKYRDGDFYILKATEGNKFIDKKAVYEMANYFQGIMNRPIGFYHFAHPEKNSAKVEANHFCKTIKSFLPCLLALDWEADALKCDIKWAREWLDIVYKKTGIRPLFYCSSSYVPKCGDVISSGNYGLWVARYSNVQKPETGAWGRFAIWQKSSKPVDIDYFNGNLQQLKKYSIPDKEIK